MKNMFLLQVMKEILNYFIFYKLIINLGEGCVIKKYYAHSNEVLNLKIINHPIYGNILISQAYEEEEIKIWSIDD